MSGHSSPGEEGPSWGDDLRWLSWWLLLLGLGAAALVCSLLSAPCRALLLTAALAATIRIEEATRP